MCNFDLVFSTDQGVFQIGGSGNFQSSNGVIGMVEISEIAIIQSTNLNISRCQTLI